MTADKPMEATSQSTSDSQAQPKRKTARKAAGRKSPAKRGKSAAASSRATSTSARPNSPRNSRSKKSVASGGNSTGAAGRLLTRGRKAASNAVEWAAASAGRALPLAARRMPDQRMVQKLADERPYMLGALGLGIGAMIGLMLPSPLSGMSGGSSSPKGRNRR